MMDESLSCAGDWIKGITPLTSYCASRYPDQLPATPPSISSLQSLRVKTAAPPIPAELERHIGALHMRSQTLDQPEGTISGEGPRGIGVSWPVAPGDVVWAATSTDRDAVRKMGVYIGGSHVIYLGRAIRSVSYSEGRAFWRMATAEDGVDETERVSLVGSADFTAGARCGTYNPSKHSGDRLWAVRRAVACFGIPFGKLTRIGAQHIAAYIRTGAWLVESPETLTRRTVSPIYFSGSYSRSNEALYAAPGFSKSAVEVSGVSESTEEEIPSEQETAFAMVSSPGFREVYHSIPLAEELYRQKEDVQPYHDPLTGSFLAEDQVADVLHMASLLRASFDTAQEKL